MIRDFLIQFTDADLSYTQIGGKFFHVSEELRVAQESINGDVESMGIFLGKEFRGRFIPSLALLTWLGDHTSKIAVIGGKAEWLFLCGRDAFTANISHCTQTTGDVLVVNLKKEVIGYGSLTTKGIKNKRHLGEYLQESP